MKKTSFILIFTLALLLVMPLSASAFAVRGDDEVSIAEDEIIEGNLYAAGTSISVDGTVKGDVICAGQSININGQVEGDVICVGQSININGSVGGSVRTAGNSININGQVGRSVQAFGILINLNGITGGDMLIGGATGKIKGRVGGDLHGGASAITIAGEVAGNVKLRVDRGKKKDKAPLQITDKATIGGNVEYSSCCQASISDNAIIKGEVTHKPLKTKIGKKRIVMGWAWSRLYSIFAALVIGLVLISLWRKPIIRITDRMLEEIGRSIGWGAVAMFLTPIIAILLLITVIGIPLALILSGIWLIALFISKVLVGIMIGRAVLEKLWHKKKNSLIWAMIIGVVIVKVIISLPIVGWLLCLLTLLWGLGGMWMQFRKI